jgi:hypothetical protein
MNNMRNWLAVVAVVVAAAAFLTFSSPGHRLLSTLGFAPACANPAC